NLLAQVGAEIRIRVDERAHRSSSLRTRLASDEASEPRPNEEDAAIALQPRQRIQRGFEILEREGLLIDFVERTKTRRSPFLVEVRIAQISCEVLALHTRVRRSRSGDERISFALARRVSPGLRCQPAHGGRCAHCNQMRDDRPARRRAKRSAGGSSAVEKLIQILQTSRRMGYPDQGVEIGLSDFIWSRWIALDRP